MASTLIFVSYARIDNEPVTEGDKGWVNDFVHSLQVKLVAKSGLRDIRVWHDRRLDPSEVVDASLAERIDAAGVFVSLLSPGYVSSRYCNLELQRFYQNPGLVVNQRSRLLVVSLSGLPRERWPESLRNSTDVPFYVLDRDSGREKLLYRPRTTDDHPYWMQLDTLTTSICAVLDDLTAESSGRDAAASPVQLARVTDAAYDVAATAGADQNHVFLAAVTDDLFDQRESLRAFLESKRIVVEVEDRAPSNREEMKSYLNQHLGRSAASVHLFNATPGRPLPDFDVPLPYIQLNRALERKGVVRPIVWLPPGLDPATVSRAAHQEFLRSLRVDDGRSLTPEVMTISFEDLKAELEQRLAVKAKPVWLNVRGTEKGGLLVYISHRTASVDDVQRLKEFFRQHHCAVSALDHSEASAQIERRHLTYLKNCDGLVIVCRQEDLEWAEDLALEAWRRAREVERPRKMAVLETPGASIHQFAFEDDLVVFLHPDQGGRFQGAESFLSALRRETSV